MFTLPSQLAPSTKLLSQCDWLDVWCVIPPLSADPPCDAWSLGGLKAENADSAGSDGRFINLCRTFCPCKSLGSTQNEQNGGY